MADRLKNLFAPVFVCLVFVVSATGQEINLLWNSTAAETSLQCRIFSPKVPAEGKNPLVVLLKNLPGRQVEDAKQIEQLVASGYVVMSVDYAGNAKATVPSLNADLLKLRKDAPVLLEKYRIDEDRMFLLPEHYRIAEDVEYYRQDGRSYRMDIRYPISGKVPVVMQTSHDNIDRRRNHGYVRYNDTLLEGLMFRGYAIAVIEHLGVGTPGGKTPVMPDYIYKLKSAVRTIRANAKKFNIDGEKLAAIGFSKGGTASAMLATMNEKELEGDGLHREYSSRITAALCLAGSYDLRDFDEIYPEVEDIERFIRVHGHPTKNKESYASISSITYITPDDAPMFFFVGEEDTTRPVLTRRMVKALKKAGHSPEHLEEAKLGHRVTLDPKAIDQMYKFLDKHLRGNNNAEK